MVHLSTLQKEKGGTLPTKGDLGPASLEEMTTVSEQGASWGFSCPVPCCV